MKNGGKKRTPKPPKDAFLFAQKIWLCSTKPSTIQDVVVLVRTLTLPLWTTSCYITCLIKKIT